MLGNAAFVFFSVRKKGREVELLVKDSVKVRVIVVMMVVFLFSGFMGGLFYKSCFFVG